MKVTLMFIGLLLLLASGGLLGYSLQTSNTYDYIGLMFGAILVFTLAFLFGIVIAGVH